MPNISCSCVCTLLSKGKSELHTKNWYSSGVQCALALMTGVIGFRTVLLYCSARLSSNIALGESPKYSKAEMAEFTHTAAL